MTIVDDSYLYHLNLDGCLQYKRGMPCYAAVVRSGAGSRDSLIAYISIR